jgi:hypothetical protein
MTDYTQHKKLYLLCFTEDTKEDAELLFKNVAKIGGTAKA